ncbi:MAG: pilus assembly protein TadG-related protein [Anaerolineales bacterium]|nr:pilus assembly protein TadG-related protein [Anaerolineales bacterium]
MTAPTPAPTATTQRRRLESGQALVIIALAFVGLAAFIGLAIDLGILVSQQAHLRRAVDSAAIAAATQWREGQTFQTISEFAGQFVAMNQLPRARVLVQRCVPGNMTQVEQYSIVMTTTVMVTDTIGMCNSTLPRKQIRVVGEMDVQFTFLGILGIRETTIFADAVAEAASVDLVLVIGTGETMGQATAPRRSDGFNVNLGPNFDPRPGGNPGCNANAGPEFTKNPENGDSPPKCRPLWDAKQAAKKLLETLYPGFDRVAVVGYDFLPRVYIPLTTTIGQRATATSNSTGVYAAIDSLELKNDVWPPPGTDYGMFNPFNVNCRSGSFGSNRNCTDMTMRANPQFSHLSNCAGCGLRVAANLLKSTGRPEALWVIILVSDGFTNVTDIPDAQAGRSGTTMESIGPDFNFPNGYCPGQVGQNAGEYGSRLFTRPVCLQGNMDINGNGVIDAGTVISSALPVRFGINWATIPLSEANTWNPSVRFCGPYHASQAECPPGAIFVGPNAMTTTAVVSPPVGVVPPYYYNALDYARDMADLAALTVNCVGDPAANCNGGGWPPNGQRYNRNEKVRGSPIVMYTVGLGPAVINVPDESGEKLLRYIAQVGDDGDRASANEPCHGAPSTTSCGNYYFAPDPQALTPIFESIAERIYTRLTR